ncbi:hypothetical protein chiPu_0027686, partial [Chiloscyllium punctatum]|nr:hypothetical protein [Chiloscyllium punctatum]
GWWVVSALCRVLVGGWFQPFAVSWLVGGFSRLPKLEELLYGAHCRLVIADLSDDLPNTLEIQQAYSKLRALCSCENPSSLKDSDEKWLSTLEGTHWLEYVRLCLKKASEISSLLSNQRLTVTLQ